MMVTFCIHKKWFALPYTWIAALHRRGSSSIDIPEPLVDGCSDASCSKNKAFFKREENQAISRKVEDGLTAWSYRLVFGENNSIFSAVERVVLDHQSDYMLCGAIHRKDTLAAQP